ncbi:sensor histidine kinase [Parablastomonas sp. CN1-191]|uniref:sensor histidine kinase n=1 Tax=Parablastomonas sp. CN1-191 TaxID=3400908 RepID=UPI003BF87491
MPAVASAVIVPPAVSAAPRLSPRLVLASIAGVWLFYFVLATVRSSMVGFESSLPMMGRRLAVTAAAMAVTVPFWPLLAAMRARPLWARAAVVLALALPASIAIAAINQWVFSDIEAQAFERLGDSKGIKIHRDESGNLLVDVPDRTKADASGAAPTAAIGGLPVPFSDRISQIADLALGRYFILLTWAALYLAFVSAEQARAAERRAGESQRAAKAAELRSLRYQVNPHFLFNTLNSLSALVMTGKAQAAEKMIDTLSNFYRRSLSEDPTADVSLAEEIRLQRLYLEIETVRFPERLRTRFQVPEELAGAHVPGMILQPLVENSVKYAVATTRAPVTLTISAEEEYGRLVLTVTDNGPGAAAPVARGTGIGLANVRDRLVARFGDAASVASGPAQDGGWRTVIRLPLVTGAD